MWVRRIVTVLVAILLGVSLAAPGSLAQQRTPRPARAGDGWTVTPSANGFVVTLRLAKPAPIRDAMPLLAVDGKPIGIAKQSADRRKLTVVTTDARVLGAQRVQLVWSPGAASSGTARLAAPNAAPPPPQRARSTTVAVDPGTRGKFRVERAEYDLGDEAVQLSGLGHLSELRAAVYAPDGAKGRRPFVLFLHGRHDYCYGDGQAEGGPGDPWPCPHGTQPVPSYRGYASPAVALASHGYQVVSISANAVNAWDFEANDGGALARAQLVLAHLDLWRRWSTVGGGPFGRRFVGKVDLHHVGLMGHSRGGEGVVRAALLNAARLKPYGIRAVLPLAPTDFSRPTIPGVAMSIVLPYCDGDVVDLQGQHFFDDTMHATPRDQAPRSTVLVLGANHNYFNTEWTPGQSAAPSWDDWWGEPKAVCGTDHRGRLSPREQQAVGRAYIAGFFRLMIGRETALLALFDGSNARAASAGRAITQVTAQAPAAARRDITAFDRSLPVSAVTGGASARLCTGVEFSWANRLAAATPTCRTVDDSAQVPHWTPAYLAPTSPAVTVTRLTWTNRSGRVRLELPAKHRDVRRLASLTMRAAPDPAAPGTPDFTVRVLDGHGRTADIATSAVSDALRSLPGTEAPLAKTMLRTVRIPLSALSGIDLRDVRAVELRTNRVSRGSVFLADLAFARPSLGRSGPSRLPRLSVSDVRMSEGDKGPRSADFTITMSRRSRLPVSVHVETSPLDFVTTVKPVSRRVVIPPGRTTGSVSVPVRPNTADSYDTTFLLVMSVPRNALVDRSIGTGQVIDDDPTPTVVVKDGSAVESDGVLGFPIRLSAASDKAVLVLGELVDGTAKLGRDFRAEEDDGQGEPVRSVLGFIEPGTASGLIPVRLINDHARENKETFSVRIDDVLEGILAGPRVVTGTIIDDD
jgi:Calx-beta domain